MMMIDPHCHGPMGSLSQIQSEHAPTIALRLKIIRIVRREPILESAANSAMSPMPNPIIPLMASHEEARGWKLSGWKAAVRHPRIRQEMRSL